MRKRIIIANCLFFHNILAVQCEHTHTIIVGAESACGINDENIIMIKNDDSYIDDDADDDLADLTIVDDEDLED